MSRRLARQWFGLAGVIVLLQRKPVEFLHAGVEFESNGLKVDAIEARIEERAVAKRARNFAEADRIRNELLAEGIVLEDKPGSLTEWRRA